MNIFLKALYTFFRLLVQVTLRLYFRRVVYINAHHLKEKGPLIVVANHPNTLIDPLLAVMHLREQCFFLANYSLFKHPVSGWLLSHLYCIPIKRPSDVPEGAPLANDAAFAKSDAHLRAGGSLFVAIEGTSEPERHLRPFKTGAARIAFSVAQAQNFDTDVRFLPIGLTYYDPLRFGSDVVIEVGEPLSPKAWAAAYAENARATTHALTETLQQKVSALVVDCTDAEEEALLAKIETLQQNDKPLSARQQHQRSKQTLQALRIFKNTQYADFQDFKYGIETYFDNLNQWQLSDTASPNRFLGRLLAVVATAPALVWGLVHNGLPAFLCEKVVQKSGIDRGYNTTVRYLLGLFIFPIYWFLVLKIAYLTGLYLYMPWYIYFLTFIPSGLYAFWAAHILRAYRNAVRYRRLPNSAERLALRAEIVRVLQSFQSSDLKS